MLSSSSTFTWRRRGGSLAGHGDVEMEEGCVRFHGRMEFGREVVKENGEEDEDGVERKWRRERKVKVGMCQNEVVRVLNEVSLG